MTILRSSSRSSSSNAMVASLWQRCVIGFAGGLLGAFAMNAFARAVDAATDGREAEGAAPGGDRVGRGVQPPQADGQADDDATVRVATAAYRALTDTEPSRAVRSWLGTGVHYAFSVTLGVGYALVAQRAPLVRAGFGTAYGTAVWAVADELIMPLFGLSRGPRQLPAGVHAYALAGHCVYGLTLETITRYGMPRSRQDRAFG
jgi:hypothetical protein